LQRRRPCRRSSINARKNTGMAGGAPALQRVSGEYLQASRAYARMPSLQHLELPPCETPVQACVVIRARGVAPLRDSNQPALAITEQHQTAHGHAEALLGRREELDKAFVPIGLIAQVGGSARAVPRRAAVLRHSRELQPWHGRVSQSHPGPEKTRRHIDVLAERVAGAVFIDRKSGG